MVDFLFKTMGIKESRMPTKKTCCMPCHGGTHSHIKEEGLVRHAIKGAEPSLL